jgi:hypothetical protein
MFVYFDSPMVSLTVLDGTAGAGGKAMAVRASRLLCYEQHTGFTRLRLSDGTQMDVRESTDEIDRRIRQAASQVDFASASSSLRKVETASVMVDA